MYKFYSVDNKEETTQHSSRMHTSRLPTVRVSVTTTKCWYCFGGIDPQVNKFEQVSNNDHQMSVAVGARSPGVMSRWWGALPCDLSHDACDVPPPVNRQTPVKTLPSCDFFSGGNKVAETWNLIFLNTAGWKATHLTHYILTQNCLK